MLFRTLTNAELVVQAQADARWQQEALFTELVLRVERGPENDNRKRPSVASDAHVRT